jgi:hypothetical protein
VNQATGDTLDHFPAEVAKDAKAHPYKYAFHALGLIAPFVKVAETYELGKAAVEAGVAYFEAYEEMSKDTPNGVDP